VWEVQLVSPAAVSRVPRVQLARRARVTLVRPVSAAPPALRELRDSRVLPENQAHLDLPVEVLPV